MKKKTPDKRVEGLKTYAAERKEKMEEKLSLIIDQMKKEGSRISFSSVAERAGVSRTTLYAHERIKERIQGLAALCADERLFVKDTPQPGKRELSDRVRALREQIKKLEADKEKLILQLVDYYELKKENERLHRQLDKKLDRERTVREEENRHDNG